jgi:lipoprotein-releasing system permease protein
MLSPYELFVGLRYTRAKRKNHFISFISITSMLGIGLGVAALIVVLSVMNGFQKELRATILGVVSHIQIAGMGGRLADWPVVDKQARSNPEVIASAPYVMAEGLLSHGRPVQGTIVRGIIPELEATVAEIGEHMRRGSLDTLVPGKYRIALGIDLARSLGASVGDRIVLIAPQGQVTPAGILPRLRQFTVSGVFELKNYQYDSGLALVHIEDAKKLFRFGDSVSGIRLKVEDLFAAPRIARELANTLPSNVYVADWTRSHANFFRAVQIEKRAMFIIGTDRETRDVHYSSTDRSRGGIQYCVDAGHGSNRQACRHRDSANPRCRARRHHENLHHPGGADRHRRHLGRFAVGRGGCDQH